MTLDAIKWALLLAGYLWLGIGYTIKALYLYLIG